MNARTLLVTLALLIQATAQARIGETLDEISARFGKPGLIMAEIRSATWVLPGELTYMVAFDKGNRSVSEGIQTKDVLTELTEAQVDKFLAPQLKPGAKWEVKAFGALDSWVAFAGKRLPIEPTRDKIYLSDDGALLARVDRLTMREVFVVNAAGFAQIMEQGRKQDEEKAVGF